MPSTKVHFLDVQQGNMVLIQCGDNSNIIVDCHITDDNHQSVMSFLKKCGVEKVDVFCATHRDADHIEGAAKLESVFFFGKMWDSGYTREDEKNLPDTYKEHAALWRRYKTNNKAKVVKTGNSESRANTLINCVSGMDACKPDEPNDQGLVLEVRDSQYPNAGSVLLTGDISRTGWLQGEVGSRVSKPVGVLMASHHGSNSFFETESTPPDWDESHLKDLRTHTTVISVGKDNQHGHPKLEALKAYERHSRNGSDSVLRTDKQGSISFQAGVNGWRRI